MARKERNVEQDEFTGEGMEYHIMEDDKIVKSYKGFMDAEGVDPREWCHSPMIVAVVFDGEPELWLVENDEGLKNLKSHCEEEWGTGRHLYVVMKPK